VHAICGAILQVTGQKATPYASHRCFLPWMTFFLFALLVDSLDSRISLSKPQGVTLGPFSKGIFDSDYNLTPSMGLFDGAK